eukprot:scaffold5077_cov95-Amphora_coffeaeformis.AAC.2
MRPGYCETQDELTVSKCILLSYLHSSHVLWFLDGHKRLIVEEFLVSGNYVITKNEPTAVTSAQTMDSKCIPAQPHATEQ